MSSAQLPNARFVRVVKTGSALGLGQLLNISIQLIIPPTFLRSYGVQNYGEWIALSAGVGWLTSLDFGLQTFIGNQLSIEFFSGNMERLRQMQSVALRISLGIVAAGIALAGFTVAVVPISRLLGLSMPQSAAARIVFFLAVQILVAILAGQLNGTLKAVGFPHRAETWGQVRLALSFGVTWVLAALGKPFWTIPVAQTLMYAVAAGCSLADLRRLAPRAFPTLSYWDRATARLVLKPSLWFGSFTLNQFLLFESPVLLLNWFAGKPAVVTFTLCRTYFGMIRQPLNVIRFALRPEITRLAAVQDWGVMQRAYGVLVSLSFSAALIGAPLFLLGAPVLLPLWTKRSDMFDPQLYGAMALATLLIVAKDCRLELQYSTNRHIRSAAICLISYAAYSILGIPATILGGPLLLVLLWGLVEAVQLALIHGENRLLLPSLTLRDAGMLIVAGSLAIGVADVMTTALPHAGVLSVLAWVAAMAAVLVIAAVVLFNLWETARLMIVRLLDRSLAVPAARIAGDAA